MKEIANIHLLLIEDNMGYLETLERRLRRFGYQHITTARNVAEARERLEQPNFDVIVSDMYMEQHDSGFDIIDLVKNLKLSSIVIILTATDNKIDCRKALRAKKAWDYIGKTNEDSSAIEVLHKSIEEAIDYFNHWGNLQDEKWLDINMADLQANYQGQYVAVLNNAILGSAPTYEELEQHILERDLPLVLTVRRKIEQPFSKPLVAELTVFVEGPTDVGYIKEAARKLKYDYLWERVDLDNVGDKTGGKGSGESNLTSSFEFLKHNPQFRPHKVLFLFDHDVKNLPLKKDDHYENLYVQRTGTYSEENKGIEQFLSAEVFESGLPKSLVTKSLIYGVDPNPNIKYRVMKKTDFCNWVCKERQNNHDDFANFEPIFKMILEILNR